MKLCQVAEVTETEVLTAHDFPEREVHKGCGADLLSDVLSVMRRISFLSPG